MKKEKEMRAKEIEWTLNSINCSVCDLTILAPLLFSYYLLILAPFIIAECVTSQLQVWPSLEISLFKTRFKGQYSKGFIGCKIKNMSPEEVISEISNDCSA